MSMGMSEKNKNLNMSFIGATDLIAKAIYKKRLVV
jgi:hypothetical protein